MSAATAVIDVGEQLQPTTIQPPDLSRLPVVDFDSMLKLEVTDDKTCALARDYGRAAKDFQSQVDLLLKEPTEAANKLHKFFTGLRGSLTGMARAVEVHTKAQIAAHLKREDEARLALQAKLQREAEERAKADAERLRAEQEAELMPWDLEGEQEQAQTKMALHVSPVVIAPAATPIGIKTARKPWDYEIFDVRQFLEAALRDETIMEYIDPENLVNRKMMKAKAQQLGKELEKRFPGVRAVQGTSVRF